MKKAAKAIFILSDAMKSLLQNAENKVELINSNKELILNTIKKVQPILGVKRVLRLLGMATSKMYYWLENKKCKNSIFKLCQSKHPNQNILINDFLQKLILSKNIYFTRNIKIGVHFQSTIKQ
jgi:hypothetical protein